MRTLDRYLATEVAAATALVLLALLMLFAFFDLVEQLKDLGRGSYHMRQIAAYVLLSLPDHAYQLFPIAALIGTIFALAQLVAGSEYTVIRTAGVSAARLAAALAGLGLAFAAVTFAFGELIAPPAQQLAQRLRSQAITGLIAQEFRSGLWIKDGTSFVNVLEVAPDATLRGVRIFEFDDSHRLRVISFAQRARYQKERRWLLEAISQTRFDGGGTTVRELARASWQTVLDPDLLSVLLVKPEQMSAASLYAYAQHLKENRQRALRYEIALWTKATYPLAVVVMMVLALPFAHLQGRQTGVGAKIFAGIMLGIGFNLLNRLFSHLGLLNGWPAYVAAPAPTLTFLALALAMLWWQERR